MNPFATELIEVDKKASPYRGDVRDFDSKTLVRVAENFMKNAYNVMKYV